MSNLPEFFSVDLVKHGDKFHVTRLDTQRFPAGKPAAQPDYEKTLAFLTEQGYELADEIPVYVPGANILSTGERKLQFRKKFEPSLFDTIMKPPQAETTEQPAASGIELVEKLTAQADTYKAESLVTKTQAQADAEHIAKHEADVRSKFGRL